MPRKKSSFSLPHAVIDNTLLSRLVELEVAIFLPLLFKTIRIPREVKREAYASPHKGKRRLQKLFREMAGFFIDCLEADELIKEYLKADLDVGEAAAIAQADYTRSVLLLDEKKGCRRARTMGLEVFRTGKLLCLLKDASAIETVKPYLDQLKRMGFHLDEQTERQILIEACEES
jgi:predicted nucleic acid-binding protein